MINDVICKTLNFFVPKDKLGMPQRKVYIDSLKLFAILLVVVTHFIAHYHKAYVALWKQIPTSWFLHGVTGKLGVAFFAVCVGWFASVSKEKMPSRYILRRYVYFVICGLLINIIYFFYSLKYSTSSKFGNNAFLSIIIQSMTLGSKIFPTYWFAFSFFCGSVLAYLNSYFCNNNRGCVALVILETTIFYTIGQTWIAVVLLGNLIGLLQSNEYVKEFLSKKTTKILFALLIFFLVKRSESKATYMIDGICSLLFLFVVENSYTLKKIFSIKFFYFSRQKFYGYITHSCCSI